MIIPASTHTQTASPSKTAESAANLIQWCWGVRIREPVGMSTIVYAKSSLRNWVTELCIADSKP